MKSITGIRTMSAVLIALALSTLACDANHDDRAEVRAGLDELLREDVATNRFLGAGLSVRLSDGRTFSTAAGRAAPEGAAYDVDGTEQIIGSVTKLYTAVLVMQLVERGRVGLDDAVDRWLSFPGADRITVRMLLGHTSGLDDYLNLLTKEQLGRPWTPRQLLDVALAAGPVGAPGMKKAIYSNTNFVVLALMVEAVTGASWEANVQERIARPLGLAHTYFAGQADRAARLAGGFIETDAGWLDVLTRLHPSAGWGGGGMVATNAELLRFTEALFDGELFDSPATLALMRQYETEIDPAYQPKEEPPSFVGLGLIRMHVGAVTLEGHLGHIHGYNAGALRDPDTGALIVVTSNDNRAFSGRTAQKVASHLRAR
jgi:CubicO group peptidase (beta-lactamase class C family)